MPTKAEHVEREARALVRSLRFIPGTNLGDLGRVDAALEAALALPADAPTLGPSSGTGVFPFKSGVRFVYPRQARDEYRMGYEDFARQYEAASGAPKWSGEVPTVAGPSWMRSSPSSPGIIGRVYSYLTGGPLRFWCARGDRLLEKWPGAEWQPIPEPVGE